jgi:hypothetical protein
MGRKVPYVYLLAMAAACPWMGGVYSMSFAGAQYTRWFALAACIPVLSMFFALDGSRPPASGVRLARIASAAFLLQLVACVVLLVLGYAHLTDGAVTWLKRGGALLGLVACVGLLRLLQSGNANEP